MAQLAERSLPTREVCGLNQVIGKIYIEHLFAVNCFRKMEIKKKRQEMTHLKKFFEMSEQILSNVVFNSEWLKNLGLH